MLFNNNLSKNIILLVLIFTMSDIGYAQSVKEYITPRDSAVFIDASHRPYKGGSDAFINHTIGKQANATLFVIDRKRILPLTQETLETVRSLNIKSQEAVTDSSSQTDVKPLSGSRQNNKNYFSVRRASMVILLPLTFTFSASTGGTFKVIFPLANVIRASLLSEPVVV